VNEQASVVGDEEVWANLWKLNAPTKIKKIWVASPTWLAAM
jgi:hypothetical protein